MHPSKRTTLSSHHGYSTAVWTRTIIASSKLIYSIASRLPRNKEKHRDPTGVLWLEAPPRAKPSAGDRRSRRAHPSARQNRQMRSVPPEAGWWRPRPEGAQSTCRHRYRPSPAVTERPPRHEHHQRQIYRIPSRHPSTLITTPLSSPNNGTLATPRARAQLHKELLQGRRGWLEKLGE